MAESAQREGHDAKEVEYYVPGMPPPYLTLR